MLARAAYTCLMEYKKQINPFVQNAYDKAQGAIDHAREVREQKIADRVKSKTAPRLIAGGDLQRLPIDLAVK
jgi:hypothetical protein